MPPRPFVNDALWRCLCPGFPSNASTLTPARAGADAILRNAPRRRDTPRRSKHQLRTYNTTPLSKESFFSQKGVQPFSFDPSTTASPKGKPSLVHLPTPHLYEHLRAEGAKGHYEEVMKINSILVKDRREKPNKEMYTAILHSFVSSDNGTAGKVRKVLEEMGFWSETSDALGGMGKVELDARGCECVLEALAVHPDYLLRTEILEYMKARWFTLSDRGHGFVVAGLLRERNFEQALETLEDMIKKKTRIEDWLFDKAIWMLLEFGEVEEAFYVLSLRADMVGGINVVKMDNALWGALLDAAGQKQLHDAANLIWTTRVQPNHLAPPTNTCMHVLTLASRAGNVPLATDVFRLLTARNTTFTTHHYEPLIATYLAADDLPAALSVILIMLSAGVKVESATCHALYWYLHAVPTRPILAFTQLMDLEAQGRRVPTSAVNACIQASIAHKNFPEALQIYKSLHGVAHAGPDTATFNILFHGCRVAARKEVAMFLVEEMMQIGVKPDRLTYDRLILVCLQADDLEDALLYYEEMRSCGRGGGTGANKSEPTVAAQQQDGPASLQDSTWTPAMRPRRGTWSDLIAKCIQKGDVRGVAVFRDLTRAGETLPKSVERRLAERFDEGGLAGEWGGEGEGEGELGGVVGGRA
ncbi:hypothetical protein P153DRAFT_432642, partial [Dothidotthia symphoricarpi CBS 119687]